MKLVKISARQFGLRIKRLKKVSGICPKCGHAIDSILKIGNVYDCPCGYFSYYSDKDLVIYDPADHPDEYWKLRALREITIASIRAQITTCKFRCENFPDYKLDLKEKLKAQIARICEFNEQMKDGLIKYNLPPIESREAGLESGEYSDSPNLPRL